MSRVAAFFDIDHTLLEINSGTQWVSYMWRTDQMSVWQLLRSLRWLTEYRFGWLDYESMATRVLAGYAGREVAPLVAEVDAWFADHVAWSICTEGRERVAEHRAAGHVVAVLSSATQFLSWPVARALGIDHVLCTTVDVQDGVFTGTHQRPACYGAGKVHYAEQFAQAHGVDLAESFFYSDSFSDLPMLERVGQPKVVNPDPRLRREARARGWAWETWTAAKPRPGAA